jgi:uncharacterized GH25 family protein
MVLLPLLLVSAAASGHDFWIEPAEFRPTVGTRVPIVLRVGEDYTGTSQPFVPQWFVDFSISSPGGRAPVQGFVGDDPAGTLEARRAGPHVIGYHSHRSFVDLEAERFESYLEAEGLQSISARRRRQGEADRSGREYYSRCAKALVQVGGGKSAPGFDRVLGYPLELVPLVDPATAGVGGQLPLRLLYRGQPIAGVLVIAFTAEQPQQRYSARTNVRGEMTLPLARAGRWLVKAVHMIPVPDSDPQADWESFWASLTFQI